MDFWWVFFFAILNIIVHEKLLLKNNMNPSDREKQIMHEKNVHEETSEKDIFGMKSESPSVLSDSL